MWCDHIVWPSLARKWALWPSWHGRHDTYALLTATNRCAQGPVTSDTRDASLVSLIGARFINIGALSCLPTGLSEPEGMNVRRCGLATSDGSSPGSLRSTGPVGVGARALCPASCWRNLPPLPCLTHPHIGASATSRQKLYRSRFRPARRTNRSRAVFVNLRDAHRPAAAHRHRYHAAARRRHHCVHHLAPGPPLGRHIAARTPPRPRPCFRAAAWAPP